MSLDVHLIYRNDEALKEWELKRAKSLEEAGTMKGLIPLIEEYYEERKPKTERREAYWSNITHNLNKMAKEAGIYEHLWRPEELGITTAKELIEPLKEGLKKLKDNPKHYEQFNASIRWGMYKHFVPFIEDYLNACIQYPDAIIEVSR